MNCTRGGTIMQHNTFPRDQSTHGTIAHNVTYYNTGLTFIQVHNRHCTYILRPIWAYPGFRRTETTMLGFTPSNNSTLHNRNPICTGNQPAECTKTIK
jgi:hypothetical protein